MPRRRNKFLLVSGPCVLEEPREALRIARTLKKEAEKLGWDFLFKASYDKANRTGIASPRGPGLLDGLEWLSAIREKAGVRVTTDVHTEDEAAAAGEVVDVLQIPAFLSRQTDLLLAAARTGCPVNVKKGQFMAPGDADAIAEKLAAGGCCEYWITERGTTFGYHNLVVDMRSLALMRHQGHRVLFDATHSVQRPSGLGATTGGDGELAPVLARAAVAAGIDGIFLETHPRPLESPSDGANMIPLAKLPILLRQLSAIHEVSSR